MFCVSSGLCPLSSVFQWTISLKTLSEIVFNNYHITTNIKITFYNTKEKIINIEISTLLASCLRSVRPFLHPYCCHLSCCALLVSPWGRAGLRSAPCSPHGSAPDHNCSHPCPPYPFHRHQNQTWSKIRVNRRHKLRLYTWFYPWAFEIQYFTSRLGHKISIQK